MRLLQIGNATFRVFINDRLHGQFTSRKAADACVEECKGEGWTVRLVKMVRTNKGVIAVDPDMKIKKIPKAGPAKPRELFSAKRTQKASYANGVSMIANNDDNGSRDALDPETVASYISTLLLADLFGADPHEVAADVIAYRRRHGLSPQAE